METSIVESMRSDIGIGMRRASCTNSNGEGIELKNGVWLESHIKRDTHDETYECSIGHE